MGTFLIFLIWRIVLIFYPAPNIGGVENNVIYFIQRILDGSSLYTDPEQSPYAIAQYAPFYYFLVAGTGKLLGISPDDLLSVMILNRSVSFLLNLFFIYLVYLLARRIFSLEKFSAAVSSMLSFIFLEITSFGRPDSLYHLLFISTLFVFYQFVSRGNTSSSTRFLLLSAVFAAIALYCKQTAIVLPVALGGWLILQKRFRSLVYFGLVYFLVAGLCFLSIYLLLGDTRVFLKNIIGGINNGIGIHWFRTVILTDFYGMFGLFHVLLFVAVFFYLNKIKEPFARFTKYILIALFVLFNGIALKLGSNPGYFTEWWSLLFVCAIFILVRELKGYSEKQQRVVFLLARAVMAVKLVFLLISFYHMIILKPYAAALEEYHAEKKLAGLIRAKLGADDKFEVFCNYNTVDSYLSGFLFRNAVMPQMDIIGLSSYDQGSYDYSDFQARLMRGDFKLMIMPQEGIQKRFFDLDLKNYQLIGNDAGLNIYEYRY